MKFKTFLFLLIALKALPSFACQRDTVKLYYNINQTELSAINKNKLDSINKFLTDTTAVQILGYADYLGKKKLNFPLSKERAETVKAYLFNLHRKNVLIIADGKGEVSTSKKNLSGLGDPFNRRVDIIRVNTSKKGAAMNTTSKVIVKRKDDSVYKRIDKLSDIKVGESLSFKELIFLPGRRFLRVEAFPYLEELAMILKTHPALRIEIQGHICCQYDHKDGYDIDSRTNTLSLDRAKYIYDYLVKGGINEGRMRYLGLGGDDPRVFPERTDDDQNQNRRVVIKVLGK